MLEPSAYLILISVAALAGFVRGFAGFGGPLMLVPVIVLHEADCCWPLCWGAGVICWGG